MGLYDVFNALGEFGEWAAGRKVQISKKDGALRFGILGAANIGYEIRVPRLKPMLTQSHFAVCKLLSPQRAHTLE
jgi:hypothetical protein